MEILGIGPMELILILIVALMVFGPDKLPQIGAKLGRGMREMRKATRAISEEINATRDAVEKPARELAQPLQDVKDVAKTAGTIAAAARNPGAALRDSVLKELNPAKSEEQPGQPAEAGAASADSAAGSAADGAADGAVEENRIAPPGLTEGEPPAESPVPFAPTLLPPVVTAPDEPAAPAALPEEPAADSGSTGLETDALPPTYPPPEQ